MILRACTRIVFAATVARGQGVSARLDSVMRVAENNGFSGVWLVERNGAVVLNKGYGLAHRANRLPFTPETVVQIGSNTKDFTAVAILQLQHAGRLSMNDTIGTYFPIVPADKRGIAIRHRMNHRSGLPLGVGEDFEPIGRTVRTGTCVATAACSRPPRTCTRSTRRCSKGNACCRATPAAGASTPTSPWDSPDRTA